MVKKTIKIISCPAVRYSLLILLSILIGVSCYALNASTLLGNRFPMPFGYGFSVILSGSMEPTLSAGDLVVIKEQETYQEGDIVAYQYGTLGVVHRLIRIDGDIAITRGDANNIEDEAITLDSIRGKIICCVPKVGNVISLLKSPVSILVMILLAVFLLELSFCSYKEKKNAEAEQLKAEIRQLLDAIEYEQGSFHGEEGGTTLEEL